MLCEQIRNTIGPSSLFFDGLTPGTPEENALRERLEQPATIELVRFYYAIPDHRVRRQFLEMVKVVAVRKQGPS
jgi:hypothetical protein